MTIEDRQKCRAALWHWKLIERQTDPRNLSWAQALRRTAAYYERRDPIRAGILKERYRRHRTEEQVLEELHIGRTTYQRPTPT